MEYLSGILRESTQLHIDDTGGCFGLLRWRPVFYLGLTLPTTAVFPFSGHMGWFLRGGMQVYSFNLARRPICHNVRDRLYPAPSLCLDE
jgi:hypothetical protein